jgi:hypothetical protein
VLTVFQLEQVFRGAVRRDLSLHHPWCANRCGSGEVCAQSLRQIGHLTKISLASAVNPSVNLIGMVGLRPEAGDEWPQLRELDFRDVRQEWGYHRYSLFLQ